MAEVLCPVMVGRQAELGALDDALAAALAGAGRMVFVTGEPGIGKSRLARELAGRARAGGATVISGRAVPSGSSTPYRPLTEALLQALRDLRLPDLRLPDPGLGDRPLGDDADLRTWLPALSAILPDATRLASPTGTGDGGLDGGAAGEPSTVIRGEAVLRLLRWLARPAGLVVLLEDLHWADPDTLAVPEYLGDNLGALPVLALATSRDEPRCAGHRGGDAGPRRQPPRRYSLPRRGGGIDGGGPRTGRADRGGNGRRRRAGGAATC